MNYTFKLSVNGAEFDVNPLFSELRISYEKPEFMIFYRKKCNTEFAFIGDDYFTIKASESAPCEQIILIIYRLGEEYWRGYCSYYDLSFDEDRCRITAKFSVLDRYNCILDNWNKKFNIFFQRLFTTPYLTIPETNVVADFQGNSKIVTTPRLLGGVALNVHFNSNDFFAGFPLTVGVGSIPINQAPFYSDNDNQPLDYRPIRTVYYTPQTGKVIGNREFQITTTWATEVYYTQDVNGVPNTPPGSGWVQYDIDTVTGLRKWQRKPYADIYDTGVGTDFYWQRWENPATKPNVEYYISNWPATETTVTYKRGLGLYALIDYLVQQSCPNLFRPYNSTMLEADINPVTRKNNPLKHAVIFASGDIARPEVSQQTNTYEISLKDLLEQVCNMLNCAWDIGEDNRFRLEHISYYNEYFEDYRLNRGSGISIPAINLVKTNRFSFNRGEMQQQETFVVKEAWFRDFIGKPIIYNQVCSNKRDGISEKQREITISTDVAMAQRFPDAIELNGLFMVINGALQKSGAFYSESDKILDDSGLFMPNLPLSLSNLHRDYYQHERILIDGNMNGEDTTFLSAMRIKNRVEITTDICDPVDFEPNDFIITDGWGNGEIHTAEHDLKKETIKLNLIY
jgi:hypothetical protein